VSDDFSDLNDTANPTWSHLSGYVNSTGQTWDASTGQYRMTAPNNGASNLGFVGSYTGSGTTDVIVQSDLVNFVDLGATQTGPKEGGVFGVAARLNGNNAVAALTGYAYVYEAFADNGNGEFVLDRINPGVSVNDLGAIGVEGVDYVRKVTLDTSKDYRFTLSIIGNLLRGEVREIGTNALIAYQTQTDSTYASGFSGYIAYSQGPTTSNPQGLAPIDVTWDNFSSTAVPEPGTALLMTFGLGFVCLGRRNR
jgi:hypothetical protein